MRAALQRLGYEGLLDLQKNRGAFVASPTVKEAADIFEARRVIERVTTEIVTRTILTHQLRALERQIDAQKMHWYRGHRQAAISGISTFHLSLAALAHNAALTAAVERLIIRTSLILALYGTTRTFSALPDAYDALMGLIASGQSHVCGQAGRTLPIRRRRRTRILPAAAPRGRSTPHHADGRLNGRAGHSPKF